MTEIISLKMPKGLRDRFDKISATFNFRSFSRFAETATMEKLEEYERRFEVHEFEHQQIKRQKEEEF